MKHYIKKVREKNSLAKKYIGSELLRQLGILGTIIMIILGIGASRIYHGDISLTEGVIALLLGIIFGYLAGRTYRIFWHTETEKVMSQMDALGIFFLIIYITIEVGKNWFFGHWLSGIELSAFTMMFLAGLLSGRCLSLYHAIRVVLRTEKEKNK